MSKPPGKGDDDRPRASARLAAVQAVYEMELADAPGDRVLADFATQRWAGVDADVADLAPPKADLLAELITGVAAQLAELDALIAPAMAGRKLDDLETVMRALLRVAAFELLARPSVPARSVISAYMAVGDAFFDDGPQTKLVNGILNSLARQTRPGEFQADADSLAAAEAAGA